jgi:hypothetical protein
MHHLRFMRLEGRPRIEKDERFLNNGFEWEERRVKSFIEAFGLIVLHF